MSLKLSKSGMGPDISVKFGEFSPMGSMISSEERKKKKEEERKTERQKDRKNERKKERIPRNTIVSWQLSCPDPNNY